MKFSLAGLLFGLGMWLAASGSAQAQSLFIKPNSGSSFQRPGVNPFQNLSPSGTPTFPGLGTTLPGGFGGTQFIDPLAFQMQQFGMGQPQVALPSSGLPPFSTQPPARYFGNYQPFYPLIPASGYSSNTIPMGGPRR